MEPLITVPKMDWIPTEFYFILPIFILVLSLVLGIYKQYSTNKSKRNENS
ncbi:MULTISPECIES: hypothetical protein [Bacillus]|nr:MULTISPECIES: hypothetical protein [Bacillus cereus group]MDF9504651.1 hypothetical protein [Bacillus cereus]MDF9595237.1 hypothetical protein [Bacillus cereus]MDF9608292.1 hypothetical protein [Bacillus cereus]MDF9660998.1 hypothetical protein [Bacillus cereus]WHS76047.1 hypothetical protein OF864_01465 [Bacillus cereus]